MFRVSVSISLFVIYLLGTIVCPPVTETPKATSEAPEEPADKDEKLGLEYEHYLKEVVAILESDENFRKKLEESNISDIKVSKLSYEKYLREVMAVLMTDKGFVKKMVAEGRNVSDKSGEIAKHLDFVAHGIRTQLDEMKRKEIDRLRQVMRLREILQKGLKASHPGIVLQELDKEKILGHLDHSNPNTFEVADLAKLIQQATRDLEEVDKRRKEEFKKYEMEKEVLRREQLKGLDDVHRQAEEKKQEEMRKKHEDHPKLHHPGNEEQLKEVWAESDGLNKRDFDLRTFFNLHDTNGDKFLDVAEVEALFQKELDKMYDPTAPEDDMMERYEEMNRMREHLFAEIDTNNDKQISLPELIDSSKSEGYKKEEGWEDIKKDAVYSEEELAQFQKNLEQRQKLEQVKQQKVPQEHHGKAGIEEHKAVNESIPGGGQPVQQPVEDHAVAQESVQQPVVHEQPVQQPVVQEQPVQQPIVQEQPMQQHVVQEQPVQQQPVQQPVVQEQPVQQPVQQQVVQEQPVQQHVVQEQPVQQPVVHQQEIIAQDQAVPHPVQFVPETAHQQQDNNNAQVVQHQEQPVVAFEQQQQQQQPVEEQQQQL